MCQLTTVLFALKKEIFSTTNQASVLMLLASDSIYQSAKISPPTQIKPIFADLSHEIVNKT
jgi:hypothetical protein